MGIELAATGSKPIQLFRVGGSIRDVEIMTLNSKRNAPLDEEFPGAAVFLPDRKSLRDLRAAAATCRGCPLYRNATQTVFGEGKARARVMLVGEMPGNDEDLEGHPFVGPAGRLLDRVLTEAGIARDETYVTNVVKHFKWEARGKRRLHSKPSRREVKACLPWLNAELDAIRPRVVVALGATAAQALIGPRFRVSQQHGEFVTWSRSEYLLATIHPSAVLRRQTAEERAQDMEMMIDDLRRVQKLIV